MSKADITLKNAVKQAGDILADYLQPGPRDCEETLDRLIIALDNEAVASAVGEIRRQRDTQPPGYGGNLSKREPTPCNQTLGSLRSFRTRPGAVPRPAARSRASRQR